MKGRGNRLLDNHHPIHFRPFLLRYDVSVKNIRDFSSNFVKYSRNQLKELQKAISSAQKYECEQKLQANISYRALENEKSLLVGYS